MIQELFEQNKSMDISEEKCEIRAVLVSVILNDADEMNTDASLDELRQLLETAGGTEYCRIVQNRQKPEHATYIGSGKLAELREICDNAGIGLAVFDCELSPSQIANIENALGETRVIDRTMLILDIFAQNARTSEGMLQVEIANLKYTLPRLSGKGTELSRLGGGIGTRGPGESKLEMNRRVIKKRIQALESELESLAQKRKTQRKSREKSGVFQIAIAGYTNAGKSTLLNGLCNDTILAENKLFATLDPTTRRMKLPNCGEVLLTDTVGFINRLPHHLVEAFKSTLDEVVFSDMVLIVMDAADGKFTQKMKITEKILSELFEKRGVVRTPFLYVLNKSDKPESIFNIQNFPTNDPYVAVSAVSGEGFERLQGEIEKILLSAKRECRFVFPHDEASKLNSLYHNATVCDVSYEADGIYVTAICDEKTKGLLSEYLIQI